MEEEVQKYNVLAILSIIFAFLFYPVGIILGIISLVQISRKGERGKGLAIAGIIIGVLLFLLTILVFLWARAFIN